jgi:hypothetical protein
MNIAALYTNPAYTPSTNGNKQAKQTEDQKTVAEFLAYQQKTPQEKIREAILQKLGLTEDSLKSLSGDTRKKVEEEIRAEFETLMKNSLAQKGILLDISV